MASPAGAGQAHPRSTPVGAGAPPPFLQDAPKLLADFKKKKSYASDARGRPRVFFKYSLDAEGTLKNLFLSDAQSQLDYGVFGDVMVFDST